MLINRKSLAKLMTSIGTLGVINMFKNILCMLLLIIGSNQAWAADDYVVYYHNDALGSPVAATNEQGNVIWKEHYHPYGEKAVNDQKSFNEKLGYTGKSFDRSTGLSYYGARYYDPVIGRFMGIDPVGFQEGNVHSFNRYAYANNNPLVFIDPDGRSPKYIGPMKRIHTMGGPGFSGGGGGMRPPGWGATRSGGGGMVSKAAVNKGMNTSFRRARMTDGNGNVMPSATKSAKPSLSTLHTRGTKIPGGRKIEDTLAGSNKIKNSNGDTFKRVDFAPSKPHNGLSPHTHPNYRNQLPDGSIRSGVSRDAGSVTRRDIIDAARQGGQRTGGL